MRAGECAAFPKGSGNGHHLVNRSGAMAVCLEVGARSPADVTIYSDIDMMSSNADGRFVHKDGTPYPEPCRGLARRLVVAAKTASFERSFASRWRGNVRRVAPLSYDETPNVMIVGIASCAIPRQPTSASGWRCQARSSSAPAPINVGGERTALSGASVDRRANPSLQVVAETVDVTSEAAVAALFARHHNIRYLQHTAGISPRPLTPPEELSKEDILGACEVNLWGAHDVLKQGIRAGAFAPRTHGVVFLSTSATVGSEGRASAAYEASKGGLLNLLTLQARYFLEAHGLVLNGLAPSPLRGPMAAQNAIGGAPASGGGRHADARPDSTHRILPRQPCSSVERMLVVGEVLPSMGAIPSTSRFMGHCEAVIRLLRSPLQDLSTLAGC